MRPIFTAFALCCASCVSYSPGAAPPGTLLISNPGPGHVAVEAIVTANPDCNPPGGGVYGKSRFSLPPDGTRFISVPLGAELCWRIVPPAAAGAPPEAAPEWNRTHVSPVELVDTSI